MLKYPVAYAAISNNVEIRKNSSSGGVFSLLAQNIIRNDGIVFGAKFDGNWEVIHDYTETIDGIKDFRGSKYVQSDMGDTYKKVEQFLKKKKKVLFSGTPCQVYGLKKFLSRDYETLFTVDLICHGVPSRKAWRHYIEKKSKGRGIKNINFRDKTEGWLDFSLAMEFDDGTYYRQNQHVDLYMKGFLQDIYLRPACYNCQFKGAKRNTDITLADLWGCEQISPEMFDNKGTSLVLIQSEKGRKIFNEIAKELTIKKLENEEYINYNLNAIYSVRITKNRLKYLKNPTWKRLEKLTKPSKQNVFWRVGRKVKHIIIK